MDSEIANTMLSDFIRQVERHFVRTFLRVSTRRTNTDAELTGSTVSVCRIDGRKTFEVDRVWYQDLLQRIDTLEVSHVSVETLAQVDYKESIETASKVVLTLWSAMRSHWGFEYDRNLFNLIESALWYVPFCGPEQQFIPFLKYQLSFLFARGEKQDELPEKPEWITHKDGLVLVGSLGRAFYIRALGAKESSREWRNTILHGIKKGLPQMGPFHLLKNLKAMKTRLTRESRTPSCLKEEIARTSREIFPRGLILDDWAGASLTTKVSDHACWENSRAKRGPLGFLHQMDHLRFNVSTGQFEEKELHSARLQPDVLLTMYYDPHVGLTHDVRAPFWTPKSIYNRLQRFSIFGEVGSSLLTDSIESLFYGEGWRGSVFDLKKGATGCARVKPIFEPLKVRMISAGDLLSNGVFSRLQQKLWSGLQKFPQFRLTGSTVKSIDIQDIHSRTNQTLEEFQFTRWVSGDYSAATDNLNGDSSRVAVEAIANDPMTRDVLLRGLQNTLISFDSIKESFEDAGDQTSADQVPDPFLMTNGQLMGCVFSFPVLCIVNIALYRASLEAYTGKRFYLRDLPVLVNGDDILFKTNDEHYAIWSALLPKVGFEKSIGKNYVSKEFCVINSQYFKTEDFRKVPYLNLGWCTGVTKGSGGRFEEGEDGDEKTILGLRSKVGRTRGDWLEEADFMIGLSAGHVTKRQGIFLRFREEIRRWNWDRITATSVSIGPGPAGLCLTDTVDPLEFAWAHYLFSHRDDRLVTHGLSSCPKTMTPWKFTKTDSVYSAFWAERKEFERLVKRRRWSPDDALWFYANQFYEQLMVTIEDDVVWKPRFSVGAF